MKKNKNQCIVTEIRQMSRLCMYNVISIFLTLCTLYVLANVFFIFGNTYFFLWNILPVPQLSSFYICTTTTSTAYLGNPIFKL